jgi:hypothetical protein
MLEVDPDLSELSSPEYQAAHPEPLRLPADATFKPDAEGRYRFKCWLPHDAVGVLHPKGRTKGWTTDQWATIGYYLANSRGTGLSFKVLSIPKGDIIVAIVNSELTIKRLGMVDGHVALLPENTYFKPIVFRNSDSDLLEVWGVVTRCLRNLR